MSVQLYYPEPLADVDIHPAFHFRHPPASKGNGLFRDVAYSFFKEAETQDVRLADAIVLTHNFIRKFDQKTSVYLNHWTDVAERIHKPLFIFSCGDFSHTLHFDPRIWVFRQSLYRSEVGPHDISFPTTTEDPPQELLFLREKMPIPVVSFCGMGGFRSTKEWCKFYVKNFLYDCVALWRPAFRAKKIGVYWRRSMMRACERSRLISTNFIVRHSFSGHVKTIELDPAQARREYLETSAHADFVLAPKGDGNYSNRFLKTLAFGRIPVVVDTDIVLPLEDVIDYSKIIVRVPMKDVAKTPEYIRTFYDALSQEEWKQRQQRARETFTIYLQQDSFLRYFFNNVLSTLYI